MNTHNSVPTSNLRANVSWPFVTLAALAFAGFPFVGALMTATIGYSSFISMLLRVVIAALATLLLVTNKPRPLSASSALVIVFWIAYFIRLYFDTFLGSHYLSQSKTYYWMWAVGGCALPMFALQQWRLTASDSRRLLIILSTMLAIAMPLIYRASHDTLIALRSAGADASRLRLEWLNPITVGHLSLSLLILLQHQFFLSDRRLHTKFPLLLGSAFSLYMLISANSRGPILAGAAVAVSLVAAGRGKVRGGAAFAVLTAAIIAVPLLQLVQDITGLAILERLGTERLVTDSSRTTLLRYSYEAFSSSPFVGWGLEVPSIASYPHNVFAEAMMALGIFGISFVGFMVLSLIKALCLVSDRNFGWIALLFIQYFVASQFSGSLYDSTSLWTLAGLLVAVSATCNVGAQKESYRGAPRTIIYHE